MWNVEWFQVYDRTKEICCDGWQYIPGVLSSWGLVILVNSHLQPAEHLGSFWSGHDVVPSLCGRLEFEVLPSIVLASKSVPSLGLDRCQYFRLSTNEYHPCIPNIRRRILDTGQVGKQL